MNREIHVPLREGVGLKFPCATRPLSENKNLPRSHHQATEGFSRKFDQLRVIATVGLHSMTAGIAMWAYGRLPWVQDNCRLNPVP
jgi:hypothetical protein